MARALELWASSLRAVKARMAPLFTQERVAASAGLFLDGLLGGERRKTGWMRAEAASDPGPADAVISHPLVQKSRQASCPIRATSVIAASAIASTPARSSPYRCTAQGDAMAENGKVKS